MFDIATIAKCLFGRIGFNPTWDADLPVTDPDLFTSRSGRFWGESHPLVTLENLQAVGTDDDSVAGFTSFNAGTVYAIGDIVRDGGLQSTTIFRKLTETAAGVPTSDTSAWSPTSPFGIWLREKVFATIKNSISGIQTRKKLDKVVKTLLEDAYLYDGAGNARDKEVKESRFVGYQIMFRGTDGIAALIDKISTQFSDVFPAETPLTIYLYNTNSNDPVAIFELAPDKVLSVQWHQLEDCILTYSDEEIGIGGAWFLGYYEDDVPSGVQAINRSAYNFQLGPCNGCGTNSYAMWSRWFQWVSIVPFAVPSGIINEDRTIWDWELNQYYYESKTWGINFHFSVSCNISDMICRQQAIFDEVIQTQFAVDMLKEMAYSTRCNRLQEITKQKAMFELDDRENRGQKGLVTQLDQKMCAVDFDFSKLGSVCAPCDEGQGIRAKSF